jgi:hypothetical protein
MSAAAHDVVSGEGIDGLMSDIDACRSSSNDGVAVLVADPRGSRGLVYRRRWHRDAGRRRSPRCGAVRPAPTFNQRRSRARVLGSLARAQLIGPARATDRVEDLRAGLEQIVDGAVRAYTTLQATPLADDAIRVLHISDIHASPLGMDFAQEVARGFDVDFVAGCLG